MVSLTEYAIIKRLWKNQNYVASSVAVRTMEEAKPGTVDVRNKGVANDNERMLGKDNAMFRKDKTQLRIGD